MPSRCRPIGMIWVIQPTEPLPQHALSIEKFERRLRDVWKPCRRPEHLKGIAERPKTPAHAMCMRQIYLKFVFMRIRKAVSVGLFALTPALTGCLVHTHTVLRTRPPDVVYGASLDRLLDQV